MVLKGKNSKINFLFGHLFSLTQCQSRQSMTTRSNSDIVTTKKLDETHEQLEGTRPPIVANISLANAQKQFTEVLEKNQPFSLQDSERKCL